MRRDHDHPMTVNLFIMVYEQPTLRRRFGRSYDDDTERVGRWVGSLETLSVTR
jgi:hypothetical protein